MQNTRQIQASPSFPRERARYTDVDAMHFHPSGAGGEGRPTNLEKLLWRSLLAVVGKEKETFRRKARRKAALPTHSRCKSVILAASEKPSHPPLLSCRSRSTSKQEWGRNGAKGTFPSPIRENHGWTQTSLRIFRINRFPISLLSCRLPQGASLPSLRDRPDTLCFSCGYCMHGRISQPASSSSSRPCDGSLKTPQRGKEEGRDRKLGYCLEKRGAAAGA